MVVYRSLNRYISKEYLKSFLVSFLFFFFIFFVNQILVLAQKILIKNVSVSDVLILVLLSIPQFLMYTMPFSSLSSASMVIGNLTSQNEILAMRANGIHLYRIFRPIIVISLIFSGCTFLIADKMIPYASAQYVNVYSSVIKKLPSLELEEYGSKQFGKIVISNGRIADNRVYDILIIDNSDSDNSRTITADSAVFEVLDTSNLIYNIRMENPEILITEKDSGKTYSLAEANELNLYLKLKNSSSASLKLSPSQMSVSQLKEKMNSANSQNIEIMSNKQSRISDYGYQLGKRLVSLESIPGEIVYVKNIEDSADAINEVSREKVKDFYYQYYRSEYAKKTALSLACTCLIFIAFPLSFVKIKYGKLTGFGVSMFIACIYWFFLYYMHAYTIQSSIEPFVLLWIPNITVFIIGLVLIFRMVRK